MGIEDAPGYEPLAESEAVPGSEDHQETSEMPRIEMPAPPSKLDQFRHLQNAKREVEGKLARQKDELSARYVVLEQQRDQLDAQMSGMKDQAFLGLQKERRGVLQALDGMDSNDAGRKELEQQLIGLDREMDQMRDGVQENKGESVEGEEGEEVVELRSDGVVEGEIVESSPSTGSGTNVEVVGAAAVVDVGEAPVDARLLADVERVMQYRVEGAELSAQERAQQLADELGVDVAGIVKLHTAYTNLNRRLGSGYPKLSFRWDEFVNAPPNGEKSGGLFGRFTKAIGMSPRKRMIREIRRKADALVGGAHEAFKVDMANRKIDLNEY